MSLYLVQIVPGATRFRAYAAVASATGEPHSPARPQQSGVFTYGSYADTWRQMRLCSTAYGAAQAIAGIYVGVQAPTSSGNGREPAIQAP
jgi:hypothetical protein